MLIVNARIFDGREFTGNNCVEFGPVIKKVYKSGKKVKKAGVIDAKGMVLSPGLIDVHTHGAANLNSLEIKSAADVHSIRVGLAKRGTTTALLATAYSYFEKNHLRLISDNVKPAAGEARLAGISLESPFVSMEKKGMIPDKYVAKITDRDATLIADLDEYCPALKMITIAPECPGALKIIRRYARTGVIVSFGHSKAGYAQTLAAIKAGARNVTHFYNAMNPLHHREPGPVAAVLENKNVMIELIADGNHVHPAVIKMTYALFGAGRIMLITDSMGTEFPGEGSYKNERYGRVAVKNGGIFSPGGSLIGSTLSLLDMCANMDKWSGCGMASALRMATSNPAGLLKIRAGRLAPGYPSDFILTDKAYKLKGVYMGGQPL